MGCEVSPHSTASSNDMEEMSLGDLLQRSLRPANAMKENKSADDLGNQTAPPSFPQKSNSKLRLQKRVLFQKKGLLAKAQRAKVVALAEQLISGKPCSSTTSSNVAANVQDPLPQNVDFEMDTHPQEVSRLTEVKNLLATLCKNVSQFGDLQQSQIIELESVIQAANDKVNAVVLSLE